MGTGEIQKIQRATEGEDISTSVKILAVMASQHPHALTSYDMGLWVRDNQKPPRPISIIVKTLSQDGLIRRLAPAGKRSAQWALTEQGLQSVRKRDLEIRLASMWLAENPNLSRLEAFILHRLLSLPAITPQAVAAETGYSSSPIRTAIKRLRLREFIVPAPRTHGACEITATGRSVAQLLILEKLN